MLLYIEWLTGEHILDPLSMSLFHDEKVVAKSLCYRNWLRKLIERECLFLCMCVGWIKCVKRSIYQRQSMCSCWYCDRCDQNRALTSIHHFMNTIMCLFGYYWIPFVINKGAGFKYQIFDSLNDKSTCQLIDWLIDWLIYDCKTIILVILPIISFT